MRTAPAVQVLVGPDITGLWALRVVALSGVAAMAAWAHLTAEASQNLWPWAVAAAVCLPLLWLTRPWTRPGAVQLRWDQQCWHVGPVGPAGGEPWSGQLSVAIDLGGWMLLRLSPSPMAPWPTWLPVSRRGHRALWHALRCAVYSPPPQSAPDAMEADPGPNERP